jgi:MtaA/CmuA family methyltransferase
VKEMASLERCITVLNNEIPDRVPVVPQSFLFACEVAGYSMYDVNHDPKLMANALIVCQEKFGYDGCVIDFDDASLAEACGAKVIYREDEPAVVDESEPLLKDLHYVEHLPLPDPYASPRLQHWLETTRTLVDEIGDHVFIMGRADQGPFSLACLLRGTQQFMLDIMTEEHELIGKVIDYCRQACALFAIAQKDAGAHATSAGDALAGPNLISPDMYRKFALEPERNLTEEIQRYGIPFSIHICGNTNSILPDMITTKARILEVDWPVNMDEAHKLCGMNTVLMGNINPSDPLVLGNPDAVDAAVKKIIQQTKGRNLFVSSGCAMGRNTKPENVKAMVNAVKIYGTYEQLLEMNL